MANVESMIVEEKQQVKQIDREKVKAAASVEHFSKFSFYYFFIDRPVPCCCVSFAPRVAITPPPSTCTAMCPAMSYKSIPGRMQLSMNWPPWCVMSIQIPVRKVPISTLQWSSPIFAAITYKCVKLESHALDKKEQMTTRHWPSSNFVLETFWISPLLRPTACHPTDAKDHTEKSLFWP